MVQGTCGNNKHKIKLVRNQFSSKINVSTLKEEKMT